MGLSCKPYGSKLESIFRKLYNEQLKEQNERSRKNANNTKKNKKKD